MATLASPPLSTTSKAVAKWGSEKQTMKRVIALSSFVASLLLCPCFLWAEVYTIDFNRGTKNGENIKTLCTEATPEAFCKTGAELITLQPTTTRSYYDTNGCGIRIATPTKTGFFYFSFSEKIKVKKIVAYASKVSGNATSTLDVYVLNEVVRAFVNEELKPYSPDEAASVDYQLPDIVIDEEFKSLKFQAPTGIVMLHRVDIYTEDGSDEDAIGSLNAVPSLNRGNIYNVAGQRTCKPLQGFYIKDGRKYIVK